jgi:hypothetical protein
MDDDPFRKALNVPPIEALKDTTRPPIVSRMPRPETVKTALVGLMG